MSNAAVARTPETTLTSSSLAGETYANRVGNSNSRLNPKRKRYPPKSNNLGSSSAKGTGNPDGDDHVSRSATVALMVRPFRLAAASISKCGAKADATARRKGEGIM